MATDERGNRFALASCPLSSGQKTTLARGLRKHSSLMH
jgi:hypothetical protein